MPIFCSKSISLRTKGVVYNRPILAILLYGSETWSLTEVLFNYLRTVHVEFVWAMCAVTKRMVLKKHIPTKSLKTLLGMQSIEIYVYRRQLAWVGHVSRMEWVRISRKCFVFSRGPSFTVRVGNAVKARFAEGVSARWVK